MLRNKEFALYLSGSMAAWLAAMWTGFSQSAAAGWIVAALGGVLIAGFCCYTWWRYRELARLSHYLSEIAGGNTQLDVRDNREGELSILKNQIYKVTLMLSEQSEYLKRDKLRLTDAISDISHQLKTPLTSMLVMSDLLGQPGLPAHKRDEFTRNITVQLERMEWLMTALLKLSKIDAGTAMFKAERVYARQLVEQAIQPLLIPIELKEQRLDVEGDASVSFIGDLNWTVEALINILKNAVEHTGPGGEIHISYEENALYTAIRVRDNGKGIPKQELPYIFQRFYKGTQASEGSIGIGLALAHSIVTSQNGTIEAASRVGEGTTFLLKFYK